MSCDSNRTRLFGTLAAIVAPLVGGSGAGQELLETLFEVASNQAPPEDRAGQLAAAAAYQKLKLRAAREGIDLYPHQSASGLPAPVAVAAWKQVGDLLDAVEGGRPLTGLAADVQQSLAFRTVVGRVRSHWGTPPSGATLRLLRAFWADDLARVRALYDDPAALGADALAPWLSEAAARLVADGTRLPPDLAAAARQYVLLDDEGMLGPEERAGWARVLAELAGVGHGLGMAEDRARWVCERCGRWVIRGWSHECTAEDARAGAEVAVALAALLAEPDSFTVDPDPSPFVTAERLLVDWMRVGTPDPPEGAMGQLLAAMRAADQQMLRRLAERHLSPYGPMSHRNFDEHAMRNATIRTPLLFEGNRYIWENGYLYPEDAYRRMSDFGLREQGYAGLFPFDEHNAHLLAEFSVLELVETMLGKPVDPHWLKFPYHCIAQRYETEQVQGTQLQDDDLIIEPCGCLYRLRSRPRKAVPGFLDRVHDVGGCPLHGNQLTLTLAESRRKQEWTRLDRKRPRFTMPTWPGTGGVRRAPEGGG